MLQVRALRYNPGANGGPKALVSKDSAVFCFCLFLLKFLEIIGKSELVLRSSPVSRECFKSVIYDPLSFQKYVYPIHLDNFCCITYGENSTIHYDLSIIKFTSTFNLKASDNCFFSALNLGTKTF